QERHHGDHYRSRCHAHLLRLRGRPQPHLVRRGLPQGLAHQQRLARGGVPEGRRAGGAPRGRRPPDAFQPPAVRGIAHAPQTRRVAARTTRARSALIYRRTVSTIPPMRTGGQRPSKRGSRDARRSGAARDSAARAASPAPLSVVILAAGEGKPMRSAHPKVLQPLAGRPLLKHVIDTARTLAPAAIQVVYGHGGEGVRSALQDEPVSWTLQAERLGTGHAVLQAMQHIPDQHLVLVLYGDVPLIGRAQLAELVALAGPRRLALLTMKADDPQGYGRIVRSARGLVQRIVEERDATRRELAIHECNTGVLACPAQLLRGWLARVKPDNSAAEYYLTDVIALAVKDRIAVRPLIAPRVSEVLGVNDKAQLAQLEAVWRAQAARELLREGVTLADPARLDLPGEVALGT